VESQHLLDNRLSKQQITDNINAFCKTISDAGYRPVVYANNKWLTNYIDMKQIPYDVWYARYGSVNNYKNRTIWQCTDQGRVEGIDGDVTIEFSFADYSALIPSEGWKSIDGNRYYTKNYVKQTGWIQVGGTWYYLDSNGIMIHDTTMDIDGVTYTFGSDGAMVQ
jgi:GH25 family lysozyme M1 (1,4-beta-N-acetylmuramidase)